MSGPFSVGLAVLCTPSTSTHVVEHALKTEDPACQAPVVLSAGQSFQFQCEDEKDHGAYWVTGVVLDCGKHSYQVAYPNEEWPATFSMAAIKNQALPPPYTPSIPSRIAIFVLVCGIRTL